MHELLLFTQIPASRHDQVLHVLAGVTAAQPIECREQNLIYMQTKLADVAVSKKAPNKQAPPAQRLSYRKLFRDLPNGVDGHAGPWKLRAEELPEAGITHVLSRPVAENVIDPTELEKFRGASIWYKYVNQYITTTHRFVNSNVIVRVSRLFLPPEGTGALEPLDAPLPNLSECRPLDASGTYLVEASVRIEDGGNAKLVEQATQELLAFKATLAGSVDLRVPDRLALDPRVKA
ncbi:Hypothetical protein R9X50_00390400 [Acrodontium crateriforme]|uniref:Mediator of RNA polymerase II transcription subunit 18 n=1 Tax=Acrodontium crateriforme TaxID=150365 RepID=A0AAQ3M3T4_9PEZI|nr:Hypothetical protein R9X50_00390400 [Acrodontium crateriforme]